MVSTLLTNIRAYLTLADDNAVQTDSTGNGYTGAVTNATYTASGKISGAHIFTGASSAVSVNEAVLDVTEDDDWTISMWIYADTVSVRGQPFYTYSGDANTFTASANLGVTTGVLSFQGAEAGNVYYSISTGNVVSASTWHHVVYLQDGANSKAYVFIDKVLRAVGTITHGTTTDANGPWEISRNHASYSFDGKICEVVFWDKALSHSTTSVTDIATGEVAELWNGGDGITYPFSSGGTTDTSGFHGVNF